jgi:hypothetical protein
MLNKLLCQQALNLKVNRKENSSLLTSIEAEPEPGVLVPWEKKNGHSAVKRTAKQLDVLYTETGPLDLRHYLLRSCVVITFVRERGRGVR